MAERKNRQWLLSARPQGLIKTSDFKWNEAIVPPLKDGEVLVRNLAFSFDPTQRGWMSFDTYIPAIPLGRLSAFCWANHKKPMAVNASKCVGCMP